MLMRVAAQATHMPTVSFMTVAAQATHMPTVSFIFRHCLLYNLLKASKFVPVQTMKVRYSSTHS